MPANLTPQYRKARERFQAASDPAEQLDALQEMLREIPKHKGTEHLQADIKRRIKEVRAEIETGKKQKKRGPSYQVDAGGHPQIVVLGPPNSGKSALVHALTGVELTVAPYPFTTYEPHPAMMPFENARVQLVDMPPIGADHMEPWIPGIVRGADAVVLVVDLDAPDLLEASEAVVAQLRSHKLFLGEVPEDRQDDVGAMGKRTLIAANKRDAADGETLALFHELFGEQSGTDLEIHPVSATTGTGLEELRSAIWSMLDLVRAIPKPPGKSPDSERPILLPRGSTVQDMARSIHGELAETLKRARAWNSKDHAEGQWVARDHVLADMEVIELET